MVAFRVVIGVLAAGLGLLLVLPVALFAVPFWIISWTTRLFRFVLEKPEVSWKQLIEYEPVIGWKPMANLDAHASADVAFHLTTDGLGWRRRETIAESDVIVFGDSFAFGYGASDAVMYPAVTPGVRVKGVGANGYNMVQSLLWMQRYAPGLDGKLVVWLIYHGNDLYENLTPNLDRYRMPFVRPSGDLTHWAIVTEHVSDAAWPSSGERPYLAKLAEISSGGNLSERAFAACEYLIGQAEETCRSAGARLVVVTAPDLTQLNPSSSSSLRSLSPSPETFDPDLPDRRIGEICRGLGVGFVPLKQHFDTGDFLVHDVHWTPTGHRRFGKVLARLHEEHRELRAGSAQTPRWSGDGAIEVQVREEDGEAAIEPAARARQLRVVD